MLPSQATRWQKFTLEQPDIHVIRELVVIGAGGHGRELADIIRAATASDPNTRLLGIADDGDPDRGLLQRCGYRFLGDSGPILRRDVEMYIGIGDPVVRQRIDNKAPELAAPPIWHPTATIGTLCEFAPGVVLAQGAVVTTNVRLGRHTHLNVRASVSHDCRVGDYVTICPDVAITGNARIGNRVFIGTSATLLPGVSVGPDAIIGAGAVVCEDVPPGTVVRGVPARASRLAA